MSLFNELKRRNVFRVGIAYIVVAWAFVMTPEGIKREHEVDRSQSITPQTGKKLNLDKALSLDGNPEYEAMQARMIEHLNRERQKLGLEPV